MNYLFSDKKFFFSRMVKTDTMCRRKMKGGQSHKIKVESLWEKEKNHTSIFFFPLMFSEVSFLGVIKI